MKTGFAIRLNKQIEEKDVASDMRGHEMKDSDNDTIFSIF